METTNNTTTYKTVYQKLAEARTEFLRTATKKSGYNKFANFSYFELADILPVATPLFSRLGLLTHMSVTETEATMTVYNTDNPIEQIVFSSPVRFPDLKGQNEIQVLGSCHTYLRRYLWMLVLDLVECDGIDAMAGAPDKTQTQQAAQNKTYNKGYSSYGGYSSR